MESKRKLCTGRCMHSSPRCQKTWSEHPLLPFTLQNRKRKTMEKIARKRARRGYSPSEKNARSRSKIALKEITRIPHVFLGTVPFVKTANHEQTARSNNSVHSFRERRTDTRRKLFGLKSNWDMYLKMRSRRKTNSFFRKGTDSMIPKVRVHFTPDTVHSSEMRKTKPTPNKWASSTWLVATAGRPFRVRTSPGCLNSRWPKISACVCSLNRSKLQRVIRISLANQNAGAQEHATLPAPHSGYKHPASVCCHQEFPFRGLVFTGTSIVFFLFE